MANPQIDQVIQALLWKAVPWIALCSAIGTFGGLAVKWLARTAKQAGRARSSQRDAERNPVNRPGQTAQGRRSSASDGYGARNPTAATGLATQKSPPPLPAVSLDDLTWENFELLVGEIFRRKGFEVEISSGLGADGGKDLTLRREGEVRLVQCKFLSPDNKVPVMAMREFYGLIVAEKAKNGIFMTTGLYSRDAREFAEGKPIELLGRAEIQKLVAEVARPGENFFHVRSWVDDFAAVANVVDPDCPRCRQPMKLRRGVTGQAFWGCSSYAKTRCRGKRDAREELVRAYSYQRS
jgi:hypothetical protein